MKNFLKRFMKKKKETKELIQKDAVLYSYNMQSGAFKKIPSVYIYKTNTKFQAVGIQYIVNDENCREVSQKENEVFYDSISGDLVVWTFIDLDDTIMQLFKQIIITYCDKTVQDTLSQLKLCRNAYSLVNQIIDGNYIKTPDRQESVRKKLNNYIFS